MVDYNRVGFLYTPKQFLSRACAVSHPMGVVEHLEPVTRDALEFVCKYPTHAVEVERKKNLLQRQLHEQMAPSLAKVLKPKNLLVWKRLLQLQGYDDLGIVNMMTGGRPWRADMTTRHAIHSLFARLR